MTKTENTDSAGNETDKLTPKAQTNKVQKTGKVAKATTEQDERAAAIEREQARVAQANAQRKIDTAANDLRGVGTIKRTQR